LRISRVSKEEEEEVIETDTLWS